MSIQDSLLVSVFGFSIVFIVLIALSFLVKLQSSIIGKISEKQKLVAAVNSIENNNVDTSDISRNEFGLSSGELKLIGVDERTAAMIMAIVSDESKIPLSELQFKSIKLLDK